MLAADEHPGAFLEDEVPFAPRAVDAATAAPSAAAGPFPGGWFQRWRVPVTALFVVLIALAVALAFGAKPDPLPAPAPLGSAPVTAASVGDPPRSASTAAPVDTVASPPPAAPALPVTSAAGPASTVTTVPASSSSSSSSSPSSSSLSSATSITTSSASPVTASGPTRPAGTATTVTSLPPPPPSATRAPPPPGTRAPPPPPPGTRTPTTAVPGYATGSTQARGPNDPPFIANPGLVTTAAGQAVRYQIGVSARPGEVLTFSATGLPRGLSIDPSTGLVTGTPGKPETAGVQVTVASSAGSRFSQGFTWVVTG